MSDVTAILKLLSDDDQTIRQHLHGQLRTDPELLAAVWNQATEHDAIPRDLARLVVEQDASDLVHHFRDPDTDVETGAWLLTLLERPRQPILTTGPAKLDALAASLPAAADAGDIARYLGRDLGISGDRSDYHAPANSMLDQVLERRCGLPMTLTMLWMIVCRRRGQTAEALVLPGHVVGRWDGGYLDPFEGGVPIGEDEIDRMCLASGFVDPERFLSPASGRDVLQRMARNLVYAYRKIGDDQRARLAAMMAL